MGIEDKLSDEHAIGEGRSTDKWVIYGWDMRVICKEIAGLAIFGGGLLAMSYDSPLNYLTPLIYLGGAGLGLGGVYIMLKTYVSASDRLMNKPINDLEKSQ